MVLVFSSSLTGPLTAWRPSDFFIWTTTTWSLFPKTCRLKPSPTSPSRTTPGAARVSWLHCAGEGLTWDVFLPADSAEQPSSHSNVKNETNRRAAASLTPLWSVPAGGWTRGTSAQRQLVRLRRLRKANRLERAPPSGAAGSKPNKKPRRTRSNETHRYLTRNELRL